MRFDFDAYSKVFPEVSEPVKPPIESITEKFTPTSDEQAKDDKPGEPDKIIDPVPETKAPTVLEQTLAGAPAEGEKQDE